MIRTFDSPTEELPVTKTFPPLSINSVIDLTLIEPPNSESFEQILYTFKKELNFEKLNSLICIYSNKR